MAAPHSDAVRYGHLLIGRVQIGILATGFGHAGLVLPLKIICETMGRQGPGAANPH
jgi:hypothetical protein